MDFSAALQEKKKTKEIVPKQPFPILDVESAKKRFAPYIEKIDGILKEAQDLKVETEEANQKAVEIGTSAKGIIKKIEETRSQSISEPYNFVKGVNAFAKIFTDKLTIIENLMKSKISQYRAFQEQKRREAELAAKKATEEVQKKLDAEAKAKGTEPVQVPLAIIPKQEAVTRTESGSAYGRKYWTFEILEPHYVRQLIADLSVAWEKKIDLKEEILKLKALSPYLVVSENEIRNAVKGGIREIPGIKIYEKESTSFRT